MFSVRAATQLDAEAISRVHVQSWLTTYAGIVPDEYLASLNKADWARLWQEWLTGDVVVFVAEMAAEVVGFVAGGALRGEQLERCDGELYAVYLLQRAQGQGIGTRLLRDLSRTLRGSGFRGLAAWVLERNPAVEFYKRRGGRMVASKEIVIGGATLTELAFVWPDLEMIASE